MNNFRNKINAILSTGSERSVLLKKNIILSIINKGFSLLVSFLLVSTTINYVNTEQYGIWLTISTLTYWISMFDFGMTHGFRNRFSEAISNNDDKLGRKYVSTSYILLSLIFIPLMAFLIVFNVRFNWSQFLNLSENINDMLKQVFMIVIICFSLKNILKITTTLFTADQRPAIASIVTTVESFLVLLIILILTHTSEGNLLYLAGVSSVVPLILLILVTFITFFFIKRYKKYRPSFKYIDFSLSKKILVLGGKFFVIQLCMLVIFQSINIIITKYLGPENVTLYQVAHKYYSVFNSAFIIILTPFWSATTNAYVKGDQVWIKNAIRKLQKMFFLGVVGQVVLIGLSPWLMKIWIGNNVVVPLDTSIFMAINVILLTYSQLYMYLINGIGKVTLQMVIYIFFSIISMPLMVYGIQIWGLNSIIILTGVVYGVLGVIGQIQLNKLIANRAKGIWNK